MGDDLLDEFYGDHLRNAPVFLRQDAEKLRSFISSHIKNGDSGEALHKIRNGRALPSKSLADCLSGMLKGNREFVLVDDQKVVYETCRSIGTSTAKKKGKSVVIVNGGPGTGKSVLAIHLLSTFLTDGLSALYVSKNSAPREVFKTRLAGDFKKSRIESLFVGSGKFHQSERDEYDVLIVDEAHRLNEKSGIFQNLGENQVKEIIEASHTSIFFLDECQRIHWKDIGSRE